MTNKNEQRKVPELRFPEFSGEIQIDIINNYFENIRNGFVGKATPYYTDNKGIIYLQSNNIKNGKINDNNLIYVNREFHELHIKNQLKLNDLLMVQSGHAGDCAVVSQKYVNANCHALIIMTPNNKIDTKYLSYYLQSNKGKKKLNHYITGNTIKHILASEIKKLSFPVVSLKEQKKIGEFFSKLDRQIELEEKKLALLEEQKKGYMQKIFSQELRFKDENGEEYPEWEENKLRNCSEYKTSNITIKSLSNEMRENLFPVYDANNIVGWSSDFQFNEGYISIIKDGAGVGRIRLLPAYSSILGTMGGITPNHEMIHLGFLYLLLEQINFSIFTTGSTIPHIYYSDYSRVQVPIPSKEEQLKISTFFNDIEQQQNCLKNKIKNLDIQKKELLTKIFV